MKKQRFNVLSPDGFAIHPTKTYASEKAAKAAMMKWIENYRAQGYYSHHRYGRISLEALPIICEIVKHGEELQEGVQMMR